MTVTLATKRLKTEIVQSARKTTLLETQTHAEGLLTRGSAKFYI